MPNDLGITSIYPNDHFIAQVLKESDPCVFRGQLNLSQTVRADGRLIHSGGLHHPKKLFLIRRCRCRRIALPYIVLM